MNIIVDLGDIALPEVAGTFVFRIMDNFQILQPVYSNLICITSQK